MGIIAFALIIMVGLLPVGLKSNSDSMAESQAVNLMQALIADREATAYATNSSIYNLPALTNITSIQTNTLYLMDDAVTTNAQPTSARYRVNYTIYPANTVYVSATNYESATVPQPVLINFRVSWPAAQTNRPSSVETTATFMEP